MSATVSRTGNASFEMRQLLVALGALILAVALLVAVAVTRQASIQTAAAPAPAPVVHDHGWSSAGHGHRIPKSAPDSNQLVIRTPEGLVYTGIPYTASEPRGTGGSNGTRFPR